MSGTETLRMPLVGTRWGGEVWVDPHMPPDLNGSSLIQAAGKKAAKALGEKDFIKGDGSNRASVRREEDRVSIMLTRPPSSLWRIYTELVHARFVFDSEDLDEVVGAMAVKTHWDAREGDVKRIWLLPFDEDQADRQFRPQDIYRLVGKAAYTINHHEQYHR
ncbi:MAG TPA: hypothetical protein VFX86_02345 [Candidatus Saccharimonadales bacterium]|nr:hypothetical protein [Candidatus Saccharimonadales bacterium]